MAEVVIGGEAIRTRRILASLSCRPSLFGNASVKGWVIDPRLSLPTGQCFHFDDKCRCDMAAG
jgi:hypothetical protein